MTAAESPRTSAGRPTATRSALRIATFVALVVALAYGLNYAVNTGLRRIRTSDFGATNQMLSGRVNADIVITGSSRALSHYDPKIIQAITGKSVFNLGRNGSQTDLQVAVFKAYLRHNARPKLVIHNLDLFTFVSSHEIYDPGQYLPYLDEPAIYQAIRAVYPDAWKWKYIPLYGYTAVDMNFDWLLGLRGLVGLDPREDHYRGFRPRSGGWTEDFDNFRRSNPDGVTIQVEPRAVRDFEELIAVCHQEGIPLLLVYSPEYRQMQLMERDRRQIFQRFQEICRRNRIPLWDYSESPLSADRTYFVNSQHLNTLGAEVFSLDLARHLASSNLFPLQVASRN